MKDKNTQAEKFDLDKIYKDHIGTIKKWALRGGIDVKSLGEVPPQDVDDIVADTMTSLVKDIQTGKFRGEHGEASIVSGLKKRYTGKRADYFRERDSEDGKQEFRNRVYSPEYRAVKWDVKLQKEVIVVAGDVAHDDYPGSPGDSGEFFKDSWFENLPPAPSPFMTEEEGEKFMRTHAGLDPMEAYISKERKAIEAEIEKGSKHPDVIEYYKEGDSRKEIAKKTNKTELQVKRIIEYEKQRRAKIGKSLGHQEVKKRSKYVDKSLAIIRDEAFWEDSTKVMARGGTIGHLDYVTPPRKVRKFKGIYTGHAKLINKMRKIQHEQYEKERICIRCHQVTKIEDMVIDNTLAYCKECHTRCEKHTEGWRYTKT